MIASLLKVRCRVPFELVDELAQIAESKATAVVVARKIRLVDAALA